MQGRGASDAGTPCRIGPADARSRARTAGFCTRWATARTEERGRRVAWKRRKTIGARYEARLAADGRIDSLADLSAGACPRAVEPLSREGLAVLSRGLGVEYRFDEDRRSRDMPYLDLLDALRQEILLTAHKVRHGELLDEPDALPALKGLLSGIAEAAAAFRRARERLVADE